MTVQYNDTKIPTFEMTNITLNNESKMGKNDGFQLAQLVKFMMVE